MSRVTSKTGTNAMASPSEDPTPVPVPVTEALLIGSKEDSEEYDRSRRVLKYVFSIGTVCGVLTIALTLVWVFEYLGGLRGPFAYHVLFMTLFMFYVHGQASLVYRILPTLSKNMVKYIHAGIHGVICVGVGVGLAAIVKNYDDQKKSHFFSLHAWIGIATIGLYYLQFLLGVFTYLLPLPFVKWSFRTKVQPMHIYMGQCLFSFSSVSTVTGLLMATRRVLEASNKMNSIATPLLIQNIIGLLMILYALFTGDILLDNRFRRRPRPEGDELGSVNMGGRHGSRVANYMDADTDGEWEDHLNA